MRVLGISAIAGFLLLLVRRRTLPVLGASLAWIRARPRAERVPDLDIAAAYHERLPAEARGDAIDDRTWRDLDLDEVFRQVDRTASLPGSQYLYHLLRTPHVTGEPLDRLERVVQGLGDAGASATVRAALARLDDPRAGQLVYLLLDELPPRPRFWWLFPILTASAVASLALVAVWPRALLALLVVALANIGVQLAYKPRVRRFVPALHELPTFLSVARVLGGLPIADARREIDCLERGARRCGLLRRATVWLRFEPGQANDMVASLYEYVNLLLLLDVNAFVFALQSLRDSRDSLRAMFAAIGYLDAAQAIAAWRAQLPRWTVPSFTDPVKGLKVTGLVHPLLREAVPNDLCLEGASVLITGSNMAGKTTFLRAMGVNAVLAQSLHTVCAGEWRAPLLRVRTSIGRTDSILDGRSYYLAEVESVRSLMRAKASGAQHLFLLDEIFRGTNTTERVAAAAAVLAYLDRGGDLVFVATHDIEVIDLLGGRYAPYHFREQVDEGALRFDFRLHPGASSTHNAISLLRMMDYPEEVVRDALAALDWQRRGEDRRG